MESETILGIRIDKIGVADVIKRIRLSINENKRVLLFNINIHGFYVSFKDEEFRKEINKADVIFCDGFGVKLGAKILGKSLGERMTPPDWIDLLCDELCLNGKSLFLLGDEPGIAEKCAEKLRLNHPQLRIIGTFHGYFLKEGEENDSVISMINECSPDVLLIGFGMPLQEKWILANYERINSKAFMPVGAMFRWISGTEKRAPKILSSNGFEGIWRLIVQPEKVWKRYLVEVPYFFYRIIKELLFNNRGKHLIN